METQRILVARETARGLYLQYRRHRHYAQVVDKEIEATYRAIAKGNVVVKALESVVAAGLGADGWPQLAIVRADAEKCFLTLRRDGSARMAMQRWTPQNHRRTFFDFPSGSFAAARWGEVEALAPLIPLEVRPRRGLENYHILFEAVWTKAPPVDPILVRRIGDRADLWVVVAAWELGEVERAVLAGRMS